MHLNFHLKTLKTLSGKFLGIALFLTGLTASADTVRPTQSIAAFVPASPHIQLGMFPAGVELHIEGKVDSKGMIKVSYISADENMVILLCRVQDLMPGTISRSLEHSKVLLVKNQIDKTTPIP